MLGKILKYGASVLSKMIKGEEKISTKESFSQPSVDTNDENDFAAVIRMIKKYESENAIIKASWQAGGDECPVYCGVEGKEDYSEEESKRFDKISDLIIQTLDLPDAGEVFNNGFATIYTKGERLFLKTTYTFYGYEYNDDGNMGEGAPKPTLTMKVKLPDPYSWENLLKRSELQIIASLDNKGIFDFWMWLSIRNGDAYEISREQNTFYHDVIEKEFQKFKTEFPGSKRNLQLYKLSLDVRLQNTLELATEVERQYVEIYEEAENREIELVW